MPILEAKTISSQSVWKTADGSREIFEVVLEIGGSQVKVKTYSKDISVAGWSGSVESYEKPGRNGSETFVKQPQKDQSSYSGANRGPNPSTKDEYPFYLAYAKDVLVAMLSTKEGYDPIKFAEYLADISTGGDTLYEAHMGATSASAQTAKKDVLDKPNEPVGSNEPEDVVVEPAEDEDFAKNIDEVFGNTADEESWKPKS